MANLNLNKVILGGRLVSDPELKNTTSGVSVTSFKIAVNRRYQKDAEQQADFISITAWRQTAEFISKYFRKGSSICVVGEIQTRSWTDSNNNKCYATEVVDSEALFVDSKGETTATPTNYTPAERSGSQGNISDSTAYIPEAYQPSASSNFEPMTGDDDLPF